MHSQVAWLRSIRYVAFLLCVIVALTAFVRTRIASEPAMPVYWSLPLYRLVDQHNNAVSSQDLVGKVVVADLIYTRCTDVCPAILQPTMEKIQTQARSAGLLGSHVVLVSLTADPANDTPPVLADFANNFHADSRGWLYLTGEPATVASLIQNGFKLDVEPGSNADRLVHDSHMLVIDQRQRVRAIYDGLDVAPATVFTAAKRLVDQQGS